jgi:alpha-tubulin suppressor-like RCC1 family protein
LPVNEDQVVHHWYKNSLIQKPSLLPFKSPVVSYSSGQRDTAAVLEDGSLFTWPAIGEDYTGHYQEYSPVSVSLPDNKKPIKVRVGADFFLVLTEDGSLYVWGDNSFGQLGQGDLQSLTNPTLVPLPSPTVDIAVGCHHAFALTEPGVLYGWGRNDDGKLGNGEKCRDSPTPGVIPFLGTVKVIGAGAHHSIGINEEGAVFTWGWNQYGNLGNGTSEDSANPVKILDEGFVNVACGWNQSMALHQDGSIWCWGTISGSLNPTQAALRKAIIPEGITPTFIGCNAYQFFFLDAQGQCYFWGAQDPQGEGTIEEPTLWPGSVFSVPWSTKKAWLSVYQWIFLGRADKHSIISVLPVEVIFHAVSVFVHGRGRFFF